MKKISRKGFLKLASASVMSGIAAGALTACQSAASSSAPALPAKYTPGTYTATAKGMGDITMTATFSETAITDIKLDLSSETASIGQAAGDELVRQLLEAQNSTIDGVSGSTITANAVKQCMNDCMTQAMGGTAVTPQAPTEEAVTWRTAPDPIADSEIRKTYETDVAIIGMGYAGLSCYRELAEQGKNVLIVEAMPRDSWWTVGHDIGHINSEYLKSHGVPEVDVVEFVNNWMMQTHGKSNPALVMSFAKNGGSAIDWWLDPVNPDTLAKTRIQFWPDNEYTVHKLNNGLHYYTGTLEWWENYWADPASGEKNNNTAGQLELKDLSWDNYNYVEANYPNATALFGTKGVQLVQDDAKVTGLIAKDSDGNYIKIHAKNGVVLAGGGFGGNKEMMNDLLPTISRIFTKDEDFFAPFGRDGSTIQMGVWAGGRLEGDISTMNFDSMTVPDYLPGPLWVDEKGQRFQNEAFAGPEINGFFMARAKRGNITSIYDSNYEPQILRGFPGHQAFEYDMPQVVDAMKANFEAARAAGAEGANGWYCADTIEQLAEYIGVEPSALCATVEQYNKVCAAGYDSDFAKDPRFLNAVAQAPFYAHVTTPSLGFALVTTGGFVTTNDQQVLNEDYQPIEGLYASGNTCGMRFGPEYITPIPGVSIGMCLTLGRELGRYLAAK